MLSHGLRGAGVPTRPAEWFQELTAPAFTVKSTPDGSPGEVQKKDWPDPKAYGRVQI